jgi:hypothetical protein
MYAVRQIVIGSKIVLKNSRRLCENLVHVGIRIAGGVENGNRTGVLLL